MNSQSEGVAVVRIKQLTFLLQRGQMATLLDPSVFSVMVFSTEKLSLK